MVRCRRKIGDKEKLKIGTEKKGDEKGVTKHVEERKKNEQERQKKGEGEKDAPHSYSCPSSFR